MLDSVVRITTVAPAVSLAEAKAQLRVTHELEDAYISALILSATESVEDSTRRAFVVNQYRATFDGLDSARCAIRQSVQIPRPRFVSVESVSINGITLAGADYTAVANYKGAALFLTLPSGQTISDRTPLIVEFTAGTVTAPPMAKQAVLLMVANLYENRTPVVAGGPSAEIPLSVSRLMDQLRVRGI